MQCVGFSVHLYKFFLFKYLQSFEGHQAPFFTQKYFDNLNAGPSEPGGRRLLPQILTDHLTLFQLGRADYAQHIATPPPRIFRPSYGPDV